MYCNLFYEVDTSYPGKFLGMRYSRLARTEAYLYGSSRLGLDTEEQVIADSLDKLRCVYNPLIKLWHKVGIADTSKQKFTVVNDSLIQYHTSGLKRYEFSNHLGNVLAVTSDRKIAVDTLSGLKVDFYYTDLYSVQDYDPFGMIQVGRSWKRKDYRFSFNGKEDESWGVQDFDARMYDKLACRWLSIDPKAHLYPSISPFVAFGNMPISLTDEKGEEPIKALSAKVDVFINTFNNTPSKMGQTRGEEAHKAMLKLSKTEWNWKQLRPLPVTTPYFNNREGRYLYTEKGGWIDMTHFLFYAGKAYGYKLDKEEAQRQMNDNSFKYLDESMQLGVLKRASQSPIGEALQDGFFQERIDPEHSSYSYEDLPSDKFGADFAVNYFDPQSKLTFGQQISNYLTNILKATDPEKAPNYSTMPEKDSKNPPSRLNKTTTPVYTEENK